MSRCYRERFTPLNILGSTPFTCKLSLGRPPGAKLGDQLPVRLEDEDAARLVVHGDDVSVPVHCHALRAQQTPRPDLILSGRRRR